MRLISRLFHIFTLLGSVLFFACQNTDQKPLWQKMDTLQEIWVSHPERMRSLFAALDIQQPALASVNNLLSAGDTVKAGESLLQYYRRLDRSWVVETLDPLNYDQALPLAIGLLHDSVQIHSYSDKIPKRANGGWQWDYTGPAQDAEFAYSLNTHGYLPALWVVWQKDQAADPAKIYDRIIKDWVIQHPLPAAGDSIYLVLEGKQGLDYRDIGEVESRTLDTGRRLGASWPQTFYGFQKADAYSPAARLLMLASICEQAKYLRQYHKSGHNWTTMEMNGLALVGLAFPEFREAEDWTQYASDVMNREIMRQVYPDGIQTEVSTKTQWVALRRFESLANNFQRAGRPLGESYHQRLEEMYHYLAYSMRPDGHQPLNNDSDREDLRPRVLLAAKKFNRSDWEWIATNGEAGNLPLNKPSVTFPWAGIHIMRNGWHKEAHWAFFDTGPYGTGHQHRDKLHLSITAFGKDLLVDGGRFTHQNYFSFDPAIWRGYFRSSFSHNVILVDGKGQNAGALRAETPLVEGKDFMHGPGYDYAHGSFSGGYEGVAGAAEHSRSVLYLHDQFWLVLDQFDTDRPREIQVLWHYAPSCQVVLEGKEALSANPEEANLRIVPLGKVAWQVEMVAGQEKPFMQGWYSENYGDKVPTPTMVYTANLSQPTIFAWLLVPANGSVPTVEAQYHLTDNTVILNIKKANQASKRIRLPLDGNLSNININ